MEQPTDRKCGFAPAGTYGHECGKPSVKVAVFSVNSTKNGLFYAGRCASCLTLKGGENAGMLRVESEMGQVNQW